ncbi:uncharacterized protein LOC125592641 [Brassica napus]|uniref:uncharacterized protein LOC125592641 n=1 Tax=Brassica napus TaxID=3708 RepID=UPI0020796C3B|nr:uncharacterized protein LOC125592641 [Brassica napus]
MAHEKFVLISRRSSSRDISKNLYELWEIDYTVEIEAPEDGETPETVRPGYCGAYTSHFQDGGLSFPLPRFLLEALAELGMAFAQMAPNFWRYFLTSWIRAREEGLSGFPGTMILAPRPGRSVIDGIPNRDDQWREKFFVFKINPVSVGDFDFEKIPRGRGRRRRYPTVLTSLPKSGRGSELRKQRGPTLRSRSQTQSPGLLARPVLIVIPVGGPRRAPNASTGSVGDRALDDDIDSSTHRRRRRALEEINSVNSNSRAQSFLPRYKLLAKDTSSWRFSYDDEVPILENPKGLALIWRKIREKGYELPPLDDMHESDAYVRMAVATAKVICLAIASDVLSG